MCSFSSEDLSCAEVSVSHQSWLHGSGQLSNKLKQRCKICTVGLKLQKITTHSTGNITKIPTEKGSLLIIHIV